MSFGVIYFQAVLFPFNVTPSLVFRLKSCHVLLLVAHHIATDGWSMNTIQNELTTLYKAKVIHGK